MQLMHYGTPSFRFELIRQVKEILVFGTLVEKKEKKKKRHRSILLDSFFIIFALYCQERPTNRDKSGEKTQK